MNEEEKAAALDEMCQRRVTAMRERARRDTALALLNEHGSVTTADVEAAVGELVVDESALADQMAAKAAASVVRHRAELARAREAVDGVRQKITKYEGLVEMARGQLDQARHAADAIEILLTDAEQVAEYAAAQGDASAAPPGAPTTAEAGRADAAGKGGA